MVIVITALAAGQISYENALALAIGCSAQNPESQLAPPISPEEMVQTQEAVIVASATLTPMAESVQGPKIDKGPTPEELEARRREAARAARRRARRRVRVPQPDYAVAGGIGVVHY